MIAEDGRPVHHLTYSDLRNLLPTGSAIDLLGGRTEIELHNSAFGHLLAIKNKQNSYPVKEADGANASILRSSNARNPQAAGQYSALSSYTSYGLIYAAALLRHVVETGLDGMENRSGQDSLETTCLPV